MNDDYTTDIDISIPERILMILTLISVIVFLVGICLGAARVEWIDPYYDLVLLSGVFFIVSVIYLNFFVFGRRYKMD